MRRVRRDVVRRFVLFVLIGAVVNVLVVVACARWESYFSQRWTRADVGVALIPLEAHDFLAPNVTSQESRPPSVPEYVLRESGTMVSTSKSYAPWSSEWPSKDWPFIGVTHDVHEFGLPMRSAWYAEQSYSSLSGDPGFGSWRVPGWRGGWPIVSTIEEQSVFGSFMMAARAYPLVPLPLGFAVNTAFYAVIAWGIAAGFAVIRRKRRRGANACAGCGYDLAGLRAGVCPECGGANVRT